ncbi:HEPN domain-containing protein [Candidatus Woesearchaeota archaeon]|nr:HEPN domain-containing protein [Candidatus Woesearchaeota archaeon]
MTKQVKQWIDFAQTDIASAKKLNEDKSLTQTAAFHCQQAVEKMFKAVLEYHQEHIKKIHNLEILYKQCSEKQTIEIDETTLKEINEVYIDSRYPSDVGLIPSGKPSTETIEKFIDFVEDLQEKIKKIFK